MEKKKISDSYGKNITAWMHCDKCIEELPPGTAPADYINVEVGLTSHGSLEIWCKRHKRRVASFALKDPPNVQCECPGCTSNQVPLFEVGNLKISKMLAAVIEKTPGLNETISRLVDRHASGDGGWTDENEKIVHFKALMSKDEMIVSRYMEVEGLPPHEIVAVCTNQDRSITKIALLKDLEEMKAEREAMEAEMAKEDNEEEDQSP